MKYVSLIIIIGLFIAGGIWLYFANQTLAPDVEENDSSLQSYTLESATLSFSYWGGGEGYTLAALGAGVAGDSTLIENARIVPTRDYLDEQTREGGEGSPAWLVSVYENAGQFTPEQWVERNDAAANYSLRISDVRERTIGNNIQAITYRTDGLYAAETFVFSAGDKMAVVSASFMDETSPTYRDLDEWLETFTLPLADVEPTPTLDAKIDVRAACESALSYTTFETGEQADAFVAQCIEGKHPEVIQRYIESIGIDGAVI